MAMSWLCTGYDMVNGYVLVMTWLCPDCDVGVLVYDVGIVHLTRCISRTRAQNRALVRAIGIASRITQC